MKKQKYQIPTVQIIRMSTENIMALSDDNPKGDIGDMPFDSSEKEWGYHDVPWAED